MSDQNDNQLENNRNFNSIMLALGRIEAKTDSTERKLDSLNDKVAIQNGRVTKLEAAHNSERGFISGMSFVGGIIGSIIIAIIVAVIKANTGSH